MPFRSSADGGSSPVPAPPPPCGPQPLPPPSAHIGSAGISRKWGLLPPPFRLADPAAQRSPNLSPPSDSKVAPAVHKQKPDLGAGLGAVQADLGFCLLFRSPFPHLQRGPGAPPHPGWPPEVL